MLQQKFINAVINNCVQEVEYYIKNTKINPIINRHDPLKKAAFYGHSNIIEILSNDDRVKIDYQNHIALKIAFERKHIHTCIKILDIYISKLKKTEEHFSKNHLTLCLLLGKNDLFKILINQNKYSTKEFEDVLIASQYYHDKWIIPLIINNLNIDLKWIHTNIHDKSYQNIIKSYINILNF